MASLSRKFVSLGAVTALVASITVGTKLQAQVDQEHWIEGPNYGANVLFGIQQEFVPALNSLDTVELSIARLSLSPAFPDGFVAVNIRSQGINGPILAVSSPAYIPPFFRGSLVFPFPESVSLVPGALYAIEPYSLVEGGQWAFDAASPPISLGYPAGRWSVFDNADLLFREGIGIIPEPTPLVLLALSLGAMVVVATSSPRLKRANPAACIAAEPNRLARSKFEGQHYGGSLRRI